MSATEEILVEFVEAACVPLDSGHATGTLVTATSAEDDAYWDMAKGSTALHVTAWRARHAVVRLLIGRGAPVDVPDGRGRTPPALAVRACVDSYWAGRRSPESVEALLRAGASPAGAGALCGYAAVDDPLRRYGGRA